MTHPKGASFHLRHQSHAYCKSTVEDCIYVTGINEREQAQVVKESKKINSTSPDMM